MCHQPSSELSYLIQVENGLEQVLGGAEPQDISLGIQVIFPGPQLQNVVGAKAQKNSAGKLMCRTFYFFS